MLRSRTTDGPEGVTLEGNDDGFALVPDAVMAGGGVLALATDGDPAPYARFLRRLVIEPLDRGRVRFSTSADGHDLILQIPIEFREVVAGNLVIPTDDPRFHVHYEHHPDHHHLAADSVPVVQPL